MNKTPSFLALLIFAGSAAAQFSTCPPGSTAVTTGAYRIASCVGSSIPGLVADTIPYATGSLRGSSYASAPLADPIFAMHERPPVLDAPRLPSAIGHLAATSTEMSAFPSSEALVPNKLAADWKFLFEGARLPPGSRISWMGGFLSRSPQGELFFSTSLRSDRFEGSIEPHRNDIRGFLSAAGPATASLFAQRYGPYAPR